MPIRVCRLPTNLRLTTPAENVILEKMDSSILVLAVRVIAWPKEEFSNVKMVSHLAGRIPGWNAGLRTTVDPTDAISNTIENVSRQASAFGKA